jgi:hypothetical protein
MKARKGIKRYSSTLSLTSTLEGGEWSKLHPYSLTPGITRYPLYNNMLGGTQGRSGLVRENFDPTGILSTVRSARSKSLSRPTTVNIFYVFRKIHNISLARLLECKTGSEICLDCQQITSFLWVYSSQVQKPLLLKFTVFRYSSGSYIFQGAADM